MGTWFRLLKQNRFSIDWSRIPIALGVSVATPANDVLALLQACIHSRRIAKTTIEHPPLFILGHWRSGTTLLHELMVLDERFACPNTYQCFAPSHFLISEKPIVRLGGFLLPKRRPMDNMEAGWKLPQEDEFALMNLGIPSPYHRIAFPRSQPKLLNYLNMEGLSEAELDRWRAGLKWFLHALTYHYQGKRLVLKSPPHTGRVKVLAEMFPGAKFIHITRDPCKLFRSSQRLWRALYDVQSLQHSPPDEVMREYVYDCLNTMYSGFEAASRDLPQGSFVNVRYEDLVAHPLATVEQLYHDLELGDFEKAEPVLQQRLASHDSYQVNQHEIDEEFRREILAKWPEYASQFGYDRPLAAQSS